MSLVSVPTVAAMAGTLCDRLREAELRLTQIAIAIAHAEDDGSNVVAIAALKPILGGTDADH